MVSFRCRPFSPYVRDSFCSREESEHQTEGKEEGEAEDGGGGGEEEEGEEEGEEEENKMFLTDGGA